MTDDARVSALLKDLLDRSPTTAPDRLLTSVLRDVGVAPQRRQPPLLQGWRRLVTSRSMRPIAVGALVVAVIGVVAVGQIVLRPATSGPGTTSSPPSSQSAPPSPSPIPSSTPAARFGEWYMPMPPGRYVMPEPNTDGVGKWPVGQVIVTVPVGWTQWGPWRGGGIVRGTNNEDATARLTFGRLGSLHPRPKPCFTALRQPGPTVDDLASGLQAVADVEVTDFAIDSYVGKRVKFAIPDPSPECRGLHGWSTPDGGEQWSYAWSPGWYHLLHILDVDGVRFVIDASYRLDASPGIAAEMEAIVGSIELHSSPVVAAETPSGITWSPSSLDQDWPASVRPEPVGGATVEPLSPGDPARYVDSLGDGGSSALPWVDIATLRVVGTNHMYVDFVADIQVPIADPRESWIAYGLVLDTNGDGAGDLRLGIDNLPSGGHRAWRTDLATGKTESKAGAGYGVVGDHYFDTWYPGEGTSLKNSARFGLDEGKFRFYAWASAIEDGRVVATDYAPDVGWLDPEPPLSLPSSSVRYVLPEPNTDGVGTWPLDRVSVMVPSDWTRVSAARGGGIRKFKEGESADESAIARLTFGRLGSLIRGPGHCPPPERLPGLTVDELVRSIPVRIDVDFGYLHIGKYVGMRLEFTVPDPSPECRELFGWSTPSGGEHWNYSWNPGWHHQLLILDIDGTRFVIDASYKLDASPTIANEVQAIVDSIELE